MHALDGQQQQQRRAKELHTRPPHPTRPSRASTSTRVIVIVFWRAGSGKREKNANWQRFSFWPPPTGVDSDDVRKPFFVPSLYFIYTLFVFILFAGDTSASPLPSSPRRRQQRTIAIERIAGRTLCCRASNTKNDAKNRVDVSACW